MQDRWIEEKDFKQMLNLGNRALEPDTSPVFDLTLTKKILEMTHAN